MDVSSTSCSGARRHQGLARPAVITRLHRQVGGIKGGSQGYTYALDVAGQRIAQTTHTRTVRRPTPSEHFVDHTLAVTDIYVTLHQPGPPGVEVLAWQSEPSCWRTFTGHGGRTLKVKPDSCAAWAVGAWELSAFFEADRATEHPGRIRRKAEQYVAYWRTGTERRTHDGVFPSVVWITPHPRRAAVLRDVIAGLEPSAQRLFTVITDGELEDFIINTPREEVTP